MLNKYNKIGVTYDCNNSTAVEHYNLLQKKHNFINLNDKVEDVEVIIALGGDGFILHTIHRFINSNANFYGINCGSVGFLTNSMAPAEDLTETLNNSASFQIYPLRVTVSGADGDFCHYAINEISLFRRSSQAVKISIKINDIARINEMICDGIVVATPVGSAAYNFSVHGPILPLNSNLIALTPISPFRPRHWRGALVSNSCKIEINIEEKQKRPVNMAADFFMYENISAINISTDTNKPITLLFNKKTTLEERILQEQFAAYDEYFSVRDK